MIKNNSKDLVTYLTQFLSFIETVSHVNEGYFPDSEIDKIKTVISLASKEQLNEEEYDYVKEEISYYDCIVNMFNGPELGEDLFLPPGIKRPVFPLFKKLLNNKISPLDVEELSLMKANV